MALWEALPKWWAAYKASPYATYTPDGNAANGPVDFMIFHRDFDALEARAKLDPNIVSVDRGLLPGLGRIVFASPASEPINALRLHPDTNFLVDSTVPILCH